MEEINSTQMHESSSPFHFGTCAHGPPSRIPRRIAFPVICSVNLALPFVPDAKLNFEPQSGVEVGYSYFYHTRHVGGSVKLHMPRELKCETEVARPTTIIFAMHCSALMLFFFF